MTEKKINNKTTKLVKTNEKENCSSKVCNKSKCFILMLIAAAALVAITYSMTKSYYQEDKKTAHNKNKSTISVDYYNDWKEINQHFHDDMKALRNDMLEFQDAMFDRLNIQRRIPDFSLDKMFNKRKSFYHHSITKNDNDYLVKVEIPGFTKEQVEIKLVGHSLVIKADNKNQDNSRQFQHIMKLQNDIDIENIKSKLENGILTVIIPRIKLKTQAISID